MRASIVLAVLVAAAPRGTPLQAQSQPSQPMNWLAGCWHGSSGGRVIEEQWMQARAGVMLGAARTTSGGTLRDYEFNELRMTGDSVTFVAMPAGQQRTVFTGHLNGAKAFVVENPANDFPTRVGYELLSRDSLRAWIEGPAEDGPRRVPYGYRRVPCEAP